MPESATPVPATPAAAPIAPVATSTASKQQMYLVLGGVAVVIVLLLAALIFFLTRGTPTSTNDGNNTNPPASSSTGSRRSVYDLSDSEYNSFYAEYDEAYDRAIIDIEAVAELIPAEGDTWFQDRIAAREEIDVRLEAELAALYEKYNIDAASILEFPELKSYTDAQLDEIAAQLEIQDESAIGSLSADDLEDYYAKYEIIVQKWLNDEISDTEYADQIEALNAEFGIEL